MPPQEVAHPTHPQTLGPPAEAQNALVPLPNGPLPFVVPEPLRRSAQIVKLGTIKPVPISWLWEGYIASGHMTLLTGIYKGGKTTLVCHLIREMAKAEGGNLGTDVHPAKVLVMTEEGANHWANRREELDLPEDTSFIFQPFRECEPNMDLWVWLIKQVLEQAQAENIKLVVVDPIANVSPVRDENKSTEMIAALRPLRILNEAGISVLILHHPRKGTSDSGFGTASRGSSALPGFVDSIMELHYYRGDDNSTRRVIRARSRFHETPRDVVIELNEETNRYDTVGSRASVSGTDMFAAIKLHLPQRPGWSPQQLYDNWDVELAGGIAQPSVRSLQRKLQEGAIAGQFGRSGIGQRSDPFTYYNP